RIAGCRFIPAIICSTSPAPLSSVASKSPTTSGKHSKANSNNSMASEPFSEFFSQIKAGYQEAKAESIRRNTPIAHWSHSFPDFNFSPTDFYRMVAEQIQAREVPDLVMELSLLHQGHVFSKKRLYLQLRRERFVFLICAA